MKYETSQSQPCGARAPISRAAPEAEPSAAWRTMEGAPRCEVLLLYGRLDRRYGCEAEHPNGLIRVTGYWDEIDGAWALVSTTWAGPFFLPTHWHPLPDPPS